VAFEATYGWGWFADLLAELGIPAHMAHPLKTKAVSSARIKNDAVDAKMLAHLLRADLLPEGWIAPPERVPCGRVIACAMDLKRRLRGYSWLERHWRSLQSCENYWEGRLLGGS
jgi:hypothetical protein